MDHLTEILIQLFAILVAAKVGNEIFRRLGQPTVVGEILGGVIAGPAVLGVYEVNAETTLFAEIMSGETAARTSSMVEIPERTLSMLS